jgi:3-hydroxyacyl-[acyl-carrier-protein] dehydratase
MSEPKLHDGMATLLESGEGHYRVRLAGAEHPVFQAHFEGNPILPGFMQLDIIAALAGKRITEIKTAKFMTPLRPKDVFCYEIVEGPKGTRVIVKDGDGKLLSDFKMLWQTL